MDGCGAAAAAWPGERVKKAHPFLSEDLIQHFSNFAEVCLPAFRLAEFLGAKAMFTGA